MARVVLTLALSIVLTAPAWAQSKKFPHACSERFVKEWTKGPDAALRYPPKKPCTMQADTGVYVCDLNGCQRPW
jgi:hypothetical protein